MWWLLAGLVPVAVLLLRRHYAPYVALYLTNKRLRARLTPMDEARLGPRLLVVAPHPDDETLGCGGLIQRALGRGAEVFVVLMTNGDGYTYQRAVLAAEDFVYGPATEHLALGRRRQRESLAALSVYGVPADHAIFLSYPDGGVQAMWQPSHWAVDRPYRSPHTKAALNPYHNSLSPGAPYSGAQVLRDLRTVLARTKPAAVFTTPPFDIHRDHWATYDFVRLALSEAARETGSRTPLYCFLVHRHEWPAPEGYGPHVPLEPPAAWLNEAGLSWFMLPLTAQQVRAKTRGLACYVSQDAAHSTELTSFVRANELFAELPEALPAGSATIPDPVGDMAPDRLRPAEDIAAIELSPPPVSEPSGPPTVEVSMRLAAEPDPRLRYVVLWHSVGGDGPQADSVAWQNGEATVRESKPTGPMGLSANVPRRYFAGAAVMLEGYSLREACYLNHTMTEVVPLQPSGASPLGAGRSADRIRRG
jgi:LmbE family N-acetylglucosaminyl deacetylase